MVGDWNAVTKRVMSSLNPAEIEVYKAAFSQYDSNHDGYICTKELSYFLSSIGDDVSNEDVLKLVRFLSNGDSRISFEHFVRFCEATRKDLGWSGEDSHVLGRLTSGYGLSEDQEKNQNEEKEEFRPPFRREETVYGTRLLQHPTTIQKTKIQNFHELYADLESLFNSYPKSDNGNVRVQYLEQTVKLLNVELEQNAADELQKLGEMNLQQFISFLNKYSELEIK